MNTLPQPLALYQASAAEIAAITAELRARWPQLWTRIDKAETILNEGGLTLDALAWHKSQIVQWRVASQADPAHHYVLGRNLHCGCTDATVEGMPSAYRTGSDKPAPKGFPKKPERPPRIDGVFYCKHALAVAIYRRVLKLHINEDIRRQQIELGVLLDGNRIAHADRLGIVILTCDPGFPLSDGVPGYSFHDGASAVRYALWLGATQGQAVTESVSRSVPSIMEVLL